MITVSPLRRLLLILVSAADFGGPAKVLARRFDDGAIFDKIGLP